MTRPMLYVSRILPNPVMAVINEHFTLIGSPSLTPPGPSIIRQSISQAVGMISTLTEHIDEEMLKEAPDLRVIANYAVGFNNIAVKAAQARGIVVTNTPDVLTETTADLAWALLLASARRVTEGSQLVQSGQWEGWSPTQLLGMDVHGKCLGIIGMGRIGRAVARRAIGFSMQVQYFTRTPLPSHLINPSWKAVSFEQVLAESDFLSLHIPLTAETFHLIGKQEFQRLKSQAILINTSRGPIIDEQALVEAIQEGALAGAGLDVYEQEPLVHPLLKTLPHVTTLPHLGSATWTTRVKMGMMCVENIRAVLEGRPAPNRVV